MHSLEPGGAAASSGKVHAGDVFYAINDANVYKLPTKDVAAKLLGARGSVVKLTLLREATKVEVELARGSISDAAIHGPRTPTASTPGNSSPQSLPLPNPLAPRM